MSKSKGFLSILIPSATVFISSACIMIIELVAGRLIARHLGSSLYTWTSIIGVVLAGITIGNYIGGRIADRFPARKTLASLFALSSAACVIVIILNNLVGNWEWLWHLDWPMRVFTHIALVFLLPSTLLGTISPVVAKMALDRGLATGRTIGNIYAWGAAGSIAGTFLAGFYLIAAMGTIAILWSVGALLLLMAIFYRASMWILYIWLAIFVALMVMATSSSLWARNTGLAMAIREKYDPEVIYQDETQYCYVSVKQVSENPDRRLFIQDKLKHSEIVMGDIDNLRYFYTHIYASITEGLKKKDDPISIMVIGGGGYAYPQYIEKNFPNSRVDVVEIDAGVTKAAQEAFGLSKDTKINTITMDARNYVDDVLFKKAQGQAVPAYDFIYEDAINDYSVPYQLVTREFNEKITSLLTADGVYMVNLIDIYDHGRFLGSIVNTLEETFPHVNVLSEDAPRSIRNTFVVVASKQPVDLKGIIGDYTKGADMWYLAPEEIDLLKKRADNIVFTDDYVPVENMLASVVRRSTIDILASKCKEWAKSLKKQGKFDESIEEYKHLVEMEPTMAILSYNEVAIMLVQQKKTAQAAEYFQKAIAYNDQARTKVNIAGVYLNLALITSQSDPEQSQHHFDLAIKGFKEQLAKEPESAQVTQVLAAALKQTGQLEEATGYFQKAVDLDPYDVNKHMALAEALEARKLYDDAVKVLEKAISFYKRYNRRQEVEQMQKYVELLEFRRSRQQQ